VYDLRKKTAVKNKNYLKPDARPKYHLQYDGFTTLLQAACKVVPGEVYHIEIAIADVSDYILDSGVYLAGHSFRSWGNKIIPLENPFRKTPPIDTLVVTSRPIPEIPVDNFVPVMQEAKVEFIFDTYSLTDSATMVIKKYYESLKEHPHAIVQVTGHTDNIGSEAYNDILSRNRALSVAHYLMQLGIEKNNIQLNYKGESSPAAGNDTPEGRARNRRVELKIGW
jgi:outer membrane protein OmpA-like peptidoglycan-associated protein